MILITGVSVDHFRSIRDQEVGDLGHFTALAGPNNSGKSNLLRALHAFFRNQTDVGLPFDFMRDYFCHDLNTKKIKRVSVTVRFELPTTFKFRKGLEAVQRLLGESFILRKVWGRNFAKPLYYLNGSASPLSPDDQALIEQFLSLISFRYIPNRVLPLDIVRNEHKALRDVLIRRIASKAKKQEDVFKAIESTSANLIKSLQISVHTACPDIGAIRLATPVSWQDLIFAFGYKIKVREAEIDDASQGSGIQSLLMFETLSLIDRDYFQKFGWKQAAIWAVEEPESSLHSMLEARVAGYLSSLASDSNNRLQVFCTTHSDIVLQYADHSVLTLMENGTTKFEQKDRTTILQEAANLGISRWSHPILHSPLDPVVLVEGKFDCAFLEQAFRLLAPQKMICVSYLEKLQGNDSTGGVNQLQQYIKMNASAIKTRISSAPVVVLLDWDSSNKINEFQKPFLTSDPLKVFAFPEESFNPELGKSFHGIERHMSTRIIDEANKSINIIAMKPDGTKTIPKEADYRTLKVAVYNVVKAGLKENDIRHVKKFLMELIKSFSNE